MIGPKFGHTLAARFNDVDIALTVEPDVSRKATAGGLLEIGRHPGSEILPGLDVPAVRSEDLNLVIPGIDHPEIALVIDRRAGWADEGLRSTGDLPNKLAYLFWRRSRGG